jgi:sRNA-binding regulator protein Hfq
MSDSSAIPKAKPAVVNPAPIASVTPSGPRKLIRPRLPEGSSMARYPTRLPALTSLVRRKPVSVASESSHAEVFYFQKQIQSQTLMTFVLEDGEQIEGHIEWYDREAIKVRHGGVRTLIYKSGIKYLYKASEKARG